MTSQLTLPPSVERRNKLDVAIGHCTDLDPGHLLSLGPAVEVRVDSPEQLVDFVLHDSEEDRLYHVDHLRSGDREWEMACFARHREWTLFVSVFSTGLAYNPLFGDGRRRRLCCGGTRIIAKRALEGASHHALATKQDELVEAVRMCLFLSEAMTGKNLSNGFNVGGSKSLVYVGPREGGIVAPEDVRELSRFMARAHNTITRDLPVFIGTGSDLNFHEHGERYYDLCSRLSPNYTGSAISARRWGRVTPGNTTAPTAAGVIACVDAVIERLALRAEDRSLLVKGLGGIGAAVARRYAELGWKIYGTELRPQVADALAAELGDRLQLVPEERWGEIPRASLFSPNSASGSVTRANLPVLQKMGVKAIVGGENNVLARDVDADAVYADHGILTFADFLVNGGGAWIVGAELVERPVEDVDDWIRDYQVPTVLKTIDLAEQTGRSPQSIFREFIARKVSELVA